MTQALATRSEDEPESCLAGGGEMGALMRGKDWSQTILGPVSSWPQSLRTSVSICINSRFPLIVWWGPQLVFLYNDAYRDMTLKDKHPSALGRPGQEVWPEIWDVVGPMLESVLHQGTATWSDDMLLFLERHGYIEETYHTFSYSPIRDESGGVGGVFTPVTETTSMVLSNRRVRTLRDLAMCGAEEKTVRGVVDRLLDTMRQNPWDIPFAAIYLLDRTQNAATLAGCVGLEQCDLLIPQMSDLHDEGGLRSLGEIVRSGRAGHVESDAVVERDIVTGPWGEPSRDTLVLPLRRSGQSGLSGFLVAGLNARRALDDDYRSFLELLAGNVETAIANAAAYEEERQRAEALAELDRAKTAFFSNVSHEFRTPLTLLLGPLDDLLSTPAATAAEELSPALSATLHMVHRNAMRLLRLVNTLLDFSRLEAGRMEAVYEPTDLCKLTGELASVFESIIERAGLHYDVDCETSGTDFYVDHEMWEKIVFNLLSNALKFTPHGEIHVRLRAVSQGGERRAQLTVSDTGIGIAAEELPRLFERFHRIRNKGARTHEGTGIGLALVKELVDMHGGTITVHSEPGVGTTFTVQLPAGSAHLPAERIGADRTEPSTRATGDAFVEEAKLWRVEAGEAPETAMPGGRVLLVEDNADMRSYISRILQPHFTVETALNGAEALIALQEHLPDVVLSDVMMPNMTGFELLARMRQDERLREVPFIFLSARAGEEATAEGLDVGADDYLVKPFSQKELLARVGRQIYLHRQHREAMQRESDARQVAELERSRLYALFQKAPALIAILEGADFVITYANPRFLEATGRSTEVLGRPVLEALPELGSQGLRPLWKRVYEHGEIIQQQDVRLRLTTNGEPDDFFFDVTYQPTRETDDTIRGVFVHAVDVTTQVRARHQVERLADELRRHRGELEDKVRGRTQQLETRTQELVAANDRLRELDRLKSEFLATMSHELRTPLNAIIGFSELLRSTPDETLPRARRIEFVQHIWRSGTVLLDLVNDVLDLARIEAGRLELEPHAFELSSVVTEVVALVKTLAEKKSVALHSSCAQERAVADTARFRQIILNLLMNAVKFTPSGGSVYVDVRLVTEGLRLEVSDTGIGIAPSDQERIFLAFEQAVRPNGVDSGTGLGLAICQKLVQAHGGRIEVESIFGQGSTFRVLIPQPPVLATPF